MYHVNRNVNNFYLALLLRILLWGGKEGEGHGEGEGEGDIKGEDEGDGVGEGEGDGIGDRVGEGEGDVKFTLGGGHTMSLHASGTKSRILSCRYCCLSCDSPLGTMTWGSWL